MHSPPGPSLSCCLDFDDSPSSKTCAAPLSSSSSSAAAASLSTTTMRRALDDVSSHDIDRVGFAIARLENEMLSPSSPMNIASKNRMNFFRTGGHFAVLRAMVEFSECPEVQSRACRTLQAWTGRCARTPLFVQALIRAGGIETVVRACAMASEHHRRAAAANREVQRSAVALLHDLCCGEEEEEIMWHLVHCTSTTITSLIVALFRAMKHGSNSNNAGGSQDVVVDELELMAMETLFVLGADARIRRAILECGLHVEEEDDDDDEDASASASRCCCSSAMTRQVILELQKQQDGYLTTR